MDVCDGDVGFWGESGVIHGVCGACVGLRDGGRLGECVGGWACEGGVCKCGLMVGYGLEEMVRWIRVLRR